MKATIYRTDNSGQLVRCAGYTIAPDSPASWLAAKGLLAFYRALYRYKGWPVFFRLTD